MEKLISWVKNNMDKVCHFLVCTLIVLIVYGVLGGLFNIPFITSIIAGVIVGMIIGVAKEVYDNKHGGIFDIYDIVADTCGCLFGVLVSLLFI